MLSNLFSSDSSERIANTVTRKTFICGQQSQCPKSPWRMAIVVRSLSWISSRARRCLISNQRICICLENVLFGILTENACPLLQLLNYFIIIGKLYLWDCRSKQILPNICGFRAKIVAKYETEGKISNKEFFKRKWILTPYLS